MDIKRLIRDLETPACEICPRQADCEQLGGGCLHLEAAAALSRLLDKVERLESGCVVYTQSAFRLGQADMRDQAVALLRAAADATHGDTRSVVLMAADLIKDMEVDIIAE